MAIHQKAIPNKDASITYFPVGNGDTSLIKLSDDTTILIDINCTEAARDEDDPTSYNVHDHLLRELRRDEQGRPHLDALILTHPDQDHIRGVSHIFYVGSPSEYSNADTKADRVIVDELWFAPRVFCEHKGDLTDDAKLVRDEAHRRKELHRSGKAAASTPGNRIRMIGSTENDDLDGVEDVTTVPGQTVNEVNGQTRSDFEFFVHAPFKQHTDDEDGECNDTSIVLQARFKVGDDPRAALALFGGDAGCAVWESICDRSDDESLEWDLLLTPHHCSWTFFSELPSEEEAPSDKILSLLDKRRRGAKVIASSKPIKDDDDNPPHFIAAEKYREKVGGSNFFCTGEHPDSRHPKPIYVTMTKNGPVKDSAASTSAVQSSAARAAAVAAPKTYG